MLNVAGQKNEKSAEFKVWDNVPERSTFSFKEIPVFRYNIVSDKLKTHRTANSLWRKERFRAVAYIAL